MCYQTTARRPLKGPKMPFFVPGDLDLQKCIRARTKHIFRVNLAHIRSAVPEIFRTHQKSHRMTVPKTEPSAVHCMW